MLYFVSTPIGNLSELSFRAVEVLKNSDCVYCEDTRRSLTLLNHYGIKKPLYSYQKFSEKKKADEIINRLKDGQTVAVISDAGTPLISDPGAHLTAELIKNDLEFTLVSGPCAAVNALVLSGLDSRSFCMCGFLPEKTSDKIKFINRFKTLTSTLIFYVPPHDVLDTLDFLFKNLGERKAAVTREITKKFEEVVRGNLGSFPPFTVKGEFVIVVEGAAEESCEFADLTVLQHLQKLISNGIDKKEAIKLVSESRRIKKSEVYAESLKL